MGHSKLRAQRIYHKAFNVEEQEKWQEVRCKQREEAFLTGRREMERVEICPV